MSAFGKDVALPLSEMDDIQSFDVVYKQYHQALYANILRIVRKPEMAEDVLQEVFMAFWEKRKALEMDRIADWLFVVSYNKSLTAVKRAARESMITLQTDNHENITLQEPEISEEEFQELLAMVNDAIGHLPERKKQIFMLYRLRGIPLADIARDLDISIATVKEHLTISNKFIRSYLSEKYAVSGLLNTVLPAFFLGIDWSAIEVTI